MSTSLNAGPDVPDRREHSPRAKVAFALAAVPAVFLPVSYMVVVVWAFCLIVPELLTGERGPPMKSPWVAVWIGWPAIYATFVQWPFYLAWAAMSCELTVRLRVLWMAYIFLLNMFAMPWFLYCKYRGTTQTALTRSLRHQRVREWFERRAT